MYVQAPGVNVRTCMIMIKHAVIIIISIHTAISGYIICVSLVDIHIHSLLMQILNLLSYDPMSVYVYHYTSVEMTIMILWCIVLNMICNASCVVWLV